MHCIELLNLIQTFSQSQNTHTDKYAMDLSQAGMQSRMQAKRLMCVTEKKRTVQNLLSTWTSTQRSTVKWLRLIALQVVVRKELLTHHSTSNRNQVSKVWWKNIEFFVLSPCSLLCIGNILVKSVLDNNGSPFAWFEVLDHRSFSVSPFGCPQEKRSESVVLFSTSMFDSHRHASCLPPPPGGGRKHLKWTSRKSSTPKVFRVDNGDEAGWGNDGKGRDNTAGTARTLELQCALLQT